jgi:protein-S-isoprenylcysteine O-methyltransferase Ste14
MPRKRYESPLFTIVLFAIMFAGIIACALDPTGLVDTGGKVDLKTFSSANQVFFVIGLLMFISGLVIRTVAILALRRNFSGALRIREGHTLTTHSIFRYIRHPAYLGAMILYIGIPVMLSSILGFLVMLLLIPILIQRIKYEEKMLIGHFGDQYLEYMKHTKKLIPFVY